MSFDWPEFQLSEKCTIKSSTRIFKKEYVETGVPFMRSKDVIDKALGVFSHFELFISKERYKEIKSKYGSPKEGDLLISSVGNRSGWPYIVQDEGDFYFKDGNVIWMSEFDGLDPDFLAYWLKSDIGQSALSSIMIGSAQKAITIDSLRKLWVSFPPFEYQQLSSDVLKLLDKKIASNKATNQTLEEIAQAIFKSWFVDFDPVIAKMNGEQPEGMDAATASLFPEKLVESELGLIPEGWPVDQVGKHIDVTKGKSYKSAELQESTTALVTLKSFKRGGGYRMDGLKEYTGKYKPQQVIEAGDLVMSLTDVTQAAEIVGKPALVIDAPQYDTLVASLDVAILRPKETDAKQYFYGLMSTYRFHRYAESFATGTTVLHLSPKGITTFEFACPSAELVKKYHEFAAPIFAKIEANILESQELAKLRDTLLPKLLSGEIELGTSEELVEAI
ncbi:restriction endonuclease subunit S [Vibrio fluvialis]